MSCLEVFVRDGDFERFGVLPNLENDRVLRDAIQEGCEPDTPLPVQFSDGNEKLVPKSEVVWKEE